MANRSNAPQAPYRHFKRHHRDRPDRHRLPRHPCALGSRGSTSPPRRFRDRRRPLLAESGRWPSRRRSEISRPVRVQRSVRPTNRTGLPDRGECPASALPVSLPRRTREALAPRPHRSEDARGGPPKEPPEPCANLTLSGRLARFRRGEARAPHVARSLASNRKRGCLAPWEPVAITPQCDARGRRGLRRQDFAARLRRLQLLRRCPSKGSTNLRAPGAIPSPLAGEGAAWSGRRGGSPVASSNLPIKNESAGSSVPAPSDFGCGGKI